MDGTIKARLGLRALATRSPRYADAPPVALLAWSALHRAWDGAGFFLRRWRVHQFDVVVVACYELARALSIQVRQSGEKKHQPDYVPSVALPTYARWAHAPAGGPSPCPTLSHLLAIRSVSTTRMERLVALLRRVVPPFLGSALLFRTAPLLLPSTERTLGALLPTSRRRGRLSAAPCRGPSLLEG